MDSGSKKPTATQSEALKQVLERAKSLLPLTPEWHTHEEKDGVKAYTRKDEAAGLKIGRGESILPASINDVFHLIWDDQEAIAEYEKARETSKIIENFSDNLRIEYVKIKPPSIIVSSRDIVAIRAWEKQADGSIMMYGCSVIDDRVPENKGTVRANNKIWFWHLKPKSDKETEVIMIFETDPMGSVPKTILNTMVKERAMCLAVMKKIIQRRK